MAACQLGSRDIALSIPSYTQDACDFNFKNRAGLSALHFAYRSKCFEVAAFLVARGALIDITNQVCDIILAAIHE